MNRAILERLESSDHGTFGRLTVGRELFFTGELPWCGNASNISCIPPGVYTCRWTYSPAFKRNLFLVDGVMKRSGIRIHSANLMGKKPPHLAQLNGCIALGEKLGWINGQKAILVSAPAVRRFETLMNHQPFILEIHDNGISR